MPAQQQAAPPRSRRDLFALISKIGVLVGLVGGIITIVFVIKPGWKPQPPTPPSAEISNVRVERPVTYRAYLQRLELPEGGLTKEFLGRRGILAEFRYVAEGLKGKALPLRWELIDETTGEAVAQEKAVDIEPTQTPERRNWFVWAELPRTKRSYHLVISLYKPGERALLAREPTGSFRGLSPT